MQDGDFAGAVEGVVAESEEIPIAIGKGEWAGDGGVGGTVAISEEGPDFVSGTAEINADAGAVVAGAREGFEEAIVGVQSGGAKPPGDGELVGGLDFGGGGDFETGTKGEVVAGSVGRGVVLGRGGGADEGAVVNTE